MLQVLNYKVTRGLPWERLVMVKNRYNHRVLKPTGARAYIKTGVFTKFQINCEVTKENGIMLSLSGTETQDLPLGSLNFDVWAVINEIDRPVAKGILEVTALDNITPREDTDYMEIRFPERSDFRKKYAWKDSNKNLVTLAGAFLQAKDTDDNTVVDLRWYNTAPDETTIAALPAAQRGYLAPFTGGTIEIHISDKNSVTTGEYLYDLFVITTDGDQKKLFSGVMVVEDSISINPT